MLLGLLFIQCLRLLSGVARVPVWMFHNFWMKILACDQLPQGRKGVVGKERGDRGLRGGDRGLRGDGGGNLFGGRQFFGKDASSGGSCQFSCWLFS